jgi:hypothetical protein
MKMDLSSLKHRCKALRDNNPFFSSRPDKIMKIIYNLLPEYNTKKYVSKINYISTTYELKKILVDMYNRIDELAKKYDIDKDDLKYALDVLYDRVGDFYYVKK